MRFHFVFEALVKYKIIFNIIKGIVKVILDDMMYSTKDKASYNNSNLEQNEEVLAFSNDAKYVIMIGNCYVITIKMKE